MKLLLPELHYNLGHVLHQQGDLVRAVAAYQQAIALEPTFTQAHHSLAVVLGEQGLYAAAIDHYQQVIALQPHAIKAYNNLGCIFVQQGRISEALQLYRQAIALKPSATLHINLGKAIAAEDPVAAISAYRRAVELEPDSLSAHYNLGHALQQQGQHAAAIRCFEQVLHRDSSHQSAHTDCGLAYLASGQLNCALDHFRQALLPQQAYVHAFCDWADRILGTDELSLARKACGQFLETLLQTHLTNKHDSPSRKRRFDEDRSAKAETATIENSSDQAQQQLAQTYLHLGNVLVQYGGTKQYQQAEIYYQKALQIRPQDLELYLRLGACLSQQQRWNAASMLYRLALTLHPNTPQIYQSLAQLLEKQQRWAEAISYYRQALQCTNDHRLLPTASHQESIQRGQIGKIYSATQQRPKLNHPHCKREDKQAEASVFSGFYASTQEWITQNQLGRYIALNPDRVDGAANIVAQNSLDIAATSSCEGLNCHRCLKQIVQQFTPLHLGHGVYACQPEAFQSNFRPFVAEIPQAQAWMIPCRTAWMITNSITVLSPDQFVLADLSRAYPGQLPGCCQSDSDHFAKIRDIWKNQPTNVKPVAGRVAVLSGLSGHNYFHWMIDILPRFALLQQSGIDLADIDWFWINDPQQPFQRETLHHLGIPPEKILAGDRHPQIQAEQLILPSFAGDLGWLEPWALQFLRQQLLKLADLHPPRHERIYISRRTAHHRRVLNERAVLEKLQAAGFVSVELETLTLTEQIALFRHAKVIVAPHGGGLTNLLFCSPGTQVVEFMAPQYMRHYYWVISRQLGLRHFFLTGEELACAPIQRLMYPSPLMEDIWINPTALNAMLNQLELD